MGIKSKAHHAGPFWVRWFMPSRRDRLMRVDVAAGSKRSVRYYIAVFLPLILLVAAALIWWASLEIREALFTENPRFTIRHLAIKTDGPLMTESHVRDYIGVAEGSTNLFDVDIAALREQFLSRAPSVKTITISRRLPDTLAIEVTERVALARLGHFKPMAVDRDGYVFNVRSAVRDLPVIAGYYDKNLRPGTQAEGLVKSALEVIDTCNLVTFSPSIKVESIDIGSGDYLDMRLRGGERVKLAWEKMNQGSSESRLNLQKKLDQLSSVLRSSASRGRRVAQVDLTFNDQYVPAQEY